MRNKAVVVRSQLFLAVLAASAILNGLLWFATLRLFPRDLPIAILHYSIGVGIDLIGEGNQIHVLPAVGSVLLVGNFLLGMVVNRVSRKAAWLMWGAVPFIQLVLGMAFVLLWRLNT